ncbi:MAG TPA: sugar isomerase domain-containing protein [Bacillota bacterium]|jgi:uncharacterized phosphosugar-binding protein|nr:sugar isomerase domain-containing protein [Bacillota bacterium]
MTSVERFQAQVVKLLGDIVNTQKDAFKEGARMMADRVADGRVIYCMGTGGHSQLATSEAFIRAGGLACIYPIYIPGVSLMHTPSVSMVMERTCGYVGGIIKNHGFSDGDLLLLFTPYGINSLTVDACLAAQELGGEVLAITSTSHADGLPVGHPARHPSNKNLYEIADHFIDCKMPYGDAVLDFDGLDTKVAASSSILVFFCLEALVAETVQELLRRGVKPEIWESINVPGGDERNQEYMRKYFHRIKSM